MRLVTDRNDLDDRIAQLDAEIAAHPMASRKMRAALAVIEEFNLGGVALVERNNACPLSQHSPESRKPTRKRGTGSTKPAKNCAARTPE